MANFINYMFNYHNSDIDNDFSAGTSECMYAA